MAVAVTEAEDGKNEGRMNNKDTDGAITELLRSFRPVTLKEMDGIRLMNRIDTKFLTDTRELYGILGDALERGYRVFEIEGKRLHAYDSIYFDTADLKTFTDHRRGKATRQKIRTRLYEDSGICFLEVKRKNNHGRTGKKRMKLPPDEFTDFRSDSSACIWLSDHSDFCAPALSPSLETRFRRVTLADEALSERLTIDLDLSFRNLRSELDAWMGAAVVIELKQDGRKASAMREILLRHRVKPLKVSKYCIGIVATDPEVMPGKFKERLRLIEKLNNKLI